MATESPIRMPGKWPSHGKGTVPSRSGSAPPNMESSYLAIDNILSQQKLGYNNKLPSFHGDTESPFYLAYYASKLNLNPRLSPPLNSRENQFLGDNTARFRSNWGLANISSPIHLSQGALSTHEEVPEEDSSPQLSARDVSGSRANMFFSGQDTGPLPGGQQDLADLKQEDTSSDPAPVRRRSNSSNYELTVTGENDAPVELSKDVESTTVKDNAALSSGSIPSLKTEVSVGIEKNLDVSAVTSKMKNIGIGNPTHPQNNNPRENVLPLRQPHQQQNNVVRNQSVRKSQMSSHFVNGAYFGTEQFLHGPPSKFSADTQPVLQSSGFTPPLYNNTNPMAYMTSTNPMYNMQSPSVYSPQYGYSVYPLTPNVIPQFIPGYPSSAAVPFVAGPNCIPQPPGLPHLRTVEQGPEMQCFEKLYGQIGQASLADPLYMQYYQQSVGQVYNRHSQMNALAPRGIVPRSQNNALETQKEGQKLSCQISGPSNPNPGKIGTMGPNYYGIQPSMGILMHYPQPQLTPPVSHGLGQFGGIYSGYQGQRGLESSNNHRLCNFLEELKSGKGRRFELSDIAGYVVEFSADQHGSRFIQQKLENCSSEEKESVFKEVLPHACKLMTDVFGNYVIQKFFEYGNSRQRKELANQLTGQILPLSLQMYGCRVIQKALDVIEPEQKAWLVRELDGHVMRCVRDQNGNHVIQKCIEGVSTDKIGFIISAFRGQVASLSMHPYGCRVIQRVLEHSKDDHQCRFIVDEILESVYALSKDQYGNYVTQHVLERGTPQERERIVRNLSGHFVQLSQHKFASNVIEKCLEYGGSTACELIIQEIMGHDDGNDNLLTMMKDQFGNYVVQKIFETCTDDQRVALSGRIRTHAAALKKYTYGKHIVARLEQLIGEESEESS